MRPARRGGRGGGGREGEEEEEEEEEEEVHLPGPSPAHTLGCWEPSIPRKRVLGAEHPDTPAVEVRNTFLKVLSMVTLHSNVLGH